MSSSSNTGEQTIELDSGPRALCGIASYFGIPAEPALIQRECALDGRPAETIDLLRAARLLGLKARETAFKGEKRLAALPTRSSPASPSPCSSPTPKT
jgi:subfamily B ATP-binding cassette protein HlyB/CyaB